MIAFNPSGLLDIATDPSDLPEQSDGKNITSEALTRCKNLHLDRNGMAKTRAGTLKYNSTAIDTDVRHVRIQGGTRYSFTGDQIYENETSITSGLTDADWSTILYNAYNDTTQQIYGLNGTDRKRIENSVVYNWGIATPSDPIYAAASDFVGTGLSGDYSVKYTELGKSGATIIRESNVTGASDTISLSDQLLLVRIDYPTDAQVTHIRIYRTATGGTSYLSDQDIPVTVRTDDDVYTFSWETAHISGTGYEFTTTSGNYEITQSWESDYSTDTNVYFMNGQWTWEDIYYLGYAVDGTLSDSPPTTNDRPPAGSYVLGPSFNGTCFIVYNNLLYYCPAKQPEYWPSTYYIEVSPPQFPGVAAVFHNGQPYYLTKNEIYYIQGTGHGTFFPLPMKAKTGAQSAQGAISVRGHGIFHIGPDGLYLFSGTDEKITQAQFDPIFKGEAVKDIPAVSDITTSWIFHRGSKLYFGYTSTGYSYPTNVLVFNLDNKKVVYYNYSMQIRTITEDETNNCIVIGDNSGFVRRIENINDTDDDGTAISWDIQSKDFTIQTNYMFPRWIKYDIDASNTDSCTGNLVLDDSTHQSHTITGNRNTIRRLIATGNGRRAAHRITGSGPVTIYLTESE